LKDLSVDGLSQMTPM